MRFKLTIEYDGTRYSGWQQQKNARTIQGELVKAAESVFQTQQLELYGAGRTDSGVHATGQVAHLEVDTHLQPNQMLQRLNDALPADIAILGLDKADPRFHARHDAVARGYFYQISKRKSAFDKRQVWWVKDALDPAAMQAAATMLEGFHDFRSFADENPKEKASTLVEMQEIRVEDYPDRVLIYLTASHFLWKMVRRIVGTLVEVGRGNLQPAQVQSFLQAYSPEPASYTAPPSGLFLAKVVYPERPTRQAAPLQNPPKNNRKEQGFQKPIKQFKKR